MRRSLWVATACAALALPTGAQAADTYNSKPYRDTVTVANMLKHERALQSFADANGGTRAAGTRQRGDDRLRRADDAPPAGTRAQPFEFPFFKATGPGDVRADGAEPATYAEDTDYALMTYSGSGDDDGAGHGRRRDGPDGPDRAGQHVNSGCEAADFAGFPAGQRSRSCSAARAPFGEKAQNAEAAGASAVVVFNEGQPGRDEPVSRAPSARPVGIPAIGVELRARRGHRDAPSAAARP